MIGVGKDLERQDIMNQAGREAAPLAPCTSKLALTISEAASILGFPVPFQYQPSTRSISHHPYSTRGVLVSPLKILDRLVQDLVLQLVEY